jgi:PKD repeat protein
MKPILPLVFFTFLIAAKNLWASTYPVTSNASDGTGTLREAIMLANDKPGTDTIIFDLPGTSVESRTIELLSPLPEITDRVILDGSTQPALPFGSSTAKIQLTANNPLVQGLWLSDDSCEVYGLFIQNFQKGILIDKQYNQVGAVGKGNVIFNCTEACIEVYSTNHIAIIGNLLGIDTAEQTGANIGAGIQIGDSYAVAIGGRSVDGRNIISGNTRGIFIKESKFIDINANYIGTGISGTTSIPNEFGIYAEDDNYNIEIGGDSSYERNVISGNTSDAIHALLIASIIQGNSIGVDVSGNLPLGNGGFGIYLAGGSSTNNIGGKFNNQDNLIAYCGKEAVFLEDATCTQNTILRNKMFCNSQISGEGGIVLNGGNANLAPPAILIANEDGVTGVTSPGAIVDVFIDAACTYCEGDSVLASTYAEANGVFTIEKDDLAGNITATATDEQGNTSAFASCTPATSFTCVLADFILPAENFCPGTLLSFTDQSVTQPGTTLSSWTWTWGDGNVTTGQNPTHTYSTGGEYTITLSAVNSLGCLSSTSKTYSVANAPDPLFAVSSPACTGTPLTFTDQSTVAEGDEITMWNWNFGDGNSSAETNPLNTYSSDSTYSVTLTVTGLYCTSQTSVPVTVYDYPASNFASPLQVCRENEVSFSDLSLAAEGDALASWFWQFGDGSNSEIQNPVYAYPGAGTFTVSLTVEGVSGCADTYESLIQVIEFPLVVPEAASLVCIGNEISFNDGSVADMGDAITSWLWDFNDGATSSDQNTVHTFSSEGTYLVSLQVSTSAGCTADSSMVITAVAPPVAQFSAAGGQCAGDPISFTDETAVNAPDGAAAWLWNFGDGSTSSLQNPSYSYSSGGMFDVNLTVTTTAGCTASTMNTFNTVSLPEALFASSGVSCEGNEISFSDLSTPGQGDNITAWSWQFGDGNQSSIQNPDYTYGDAGNFEVTLTVTTAAGCMNSYSAPLVINALPAASFTLEEQGLLVSFSNTSSSAGGASFSWDFGDGETSTEENPIHHFPSDGNYEVCLTIYDSVCQATATGCITFDLLTAIETSGTIRLTVFPNPADERIILRGLAPGQLVSISVFNSLGQQVIQLPALISENEMELDLQMLPEGSYLVRVLAEDDSALIRLIEVIH